ncbi:MAG: hypothetical protein IT379_21275 [Deltaproteobacteria bacterium]|nr:hypothetical protein [Deltaproteobacteria bacterium]
MIASGRLACAALGLAALGVVTACGGSSVSRRTRATTSPCPCDDAPVPAPLPAAETMPAPVGEPVGESSSGLARRESRTIRIEHVEPADDGPIEPRSRASRVPRGRRVDVAFREADLANALRFLASAGGLNLVLGDGLAGTVTVELRRVRALDAIVALAESHGATVEMREGIVLVRAR